MDFELIHFFDAPVEAVENAMFQPAYGAFLVDQTELMTRQALLSCEELSCEDERGLIRRRLLRSPRPSFDSIGPLRFPPELFEFIEDSTWDPAHRKLTFENIPTADKVAAQVDNRGEVTFSPLGAAKSQRTTRVQIKVLRLPLLVRPFTSLVEQALVREAKRMLEGEAAALRAFLATKGALQHGQQPRAQRSVQGQSASFSLVAS
jgi:hypothetical protein